VQTGRAGVRGMNLAFERLHGRERALDGVPFAGRTDRAIVIDVMRRIGVDPTDSAITALRDAYIDALRTEIVRPVADPSGVLPGVNALLDALDAESGVVTALLTGNFLLGAQVKLQHFTIWDRFRFGAFGDEHSDRRQLVPIAVECARRAGHPGFLPAHVVIIGDTPNDVDCARAYGARAIGVTTGSYDRATLCAAGADLTVDSLEDVPLLLTEIRKSSS
jgi:phosphoglycolate phosphatase